MKTIISKMVGQFAGFAGLFLLALMLSPFVADSAKAQNKAAKMGSGKKAAASKNAGKKGKIKKSQAKEAGDDNDEPKIVKLPPRTGEFVAGDPISKTATSFGITPALRDMPELANPRSNFDGELEIKDEENNEVQVERTVNGLGEKPFNDPLSFKSREKFSILSPQAMPGPALSFNGILNTDIITAFGAASMPPDTIGDVGPNHYVQSVNIGVFRIYNKSGAPLTNLARISTLFASLPANDPCRTGDNGDPVINYDPLADRWLISQFYVNRPTFGQCIAVSRTGDPTGAWYAYSFPSPAGNFADYPHWAVWTDGYYLATHEFNAAGTAYVAGGFYAFDRNKMLVGDPTASYIFFTDPNSFGHLPADIDGYQPPPAGTSEYFVEYGTNNLIIHELVPNYTTPASSTFTLKPSLPVAPFDFRNPSGRADIEQPVVPATSYLDSLASNNMFRVAYRNLGTAAAPVNSYVTNWTVNVSGVNPTTAATYQAGIRWEELRRDGAGALSVFDQGTHAPDPVSGTGRNRWMGSIAQDYLGNLALGFSRSGPGATEFPDIVWAGRTGGQTAAGTMNEGEATMHPSTGYQNINNSRWGDYSAMTVDPTDDCTFWYTTEWRDAAFNGTTNSDPFKWSTRIGNFKFPSCTAAPKGQIAVNVTNCDTGQPINGAAVIAQVGGFLRETNAAGNLVTNIIAAPGTYTVSGFRNGFTGSTTANVTVSNGGIATANICLSGAFTIIELVASPPAAIPVDENSNGRLDPGESATVNIPLRNVGGLDAANVSATLTTTTPGVTILPPQTLAYPNIPANGETRSSAMPFKFRLDSNFVCGGPVSFTLTVNYNGTPAAETFNFTINTLPPVSISTILDTTAPPTNPDYTATTGTQTGRLARTGVVSACGTAKPAPGLTIATGARRYDAYTFTASAAGCITVTLSATNGATIYSAAYNSTGFVPANPNTNYLADAGSSGDLVSYSFNVTAGQAFTVVVHEVDINGANLVPYTLSLAGPVARTCQNYTAPIGGQGTEGDVASRFTGDGTYQADDPSLIEQFLIGAATPNPSFNEFQRADVAPYASRGDGILDITDVNLAEDYLISRVASQMAGGPLNPNATPAPSLESSAALSNVKGDVKTERAALLPRVVRADNVTSSAGMQVVVPILIDAEGDETGYSFTLDYDPMVLTNPAVLAGDPTVGGTRAFVIGASNPNDGVADGKITFSLRNFSMGANGNSVNAGNNQVIVRVRFTVAAGAQAGTTPITFSGQPTPNSVTNQNSMLLATTFTPGQVNITGPSAAGASIGGRVVTSAGRGIRNVVVSLTDGRGNSRTAVTTAFGYYQFADVAAGQSYTVSAQAKRYRFGQATRTINVNADDDSINFIASGN